MERENQPEVPQKPIPKPTLGDYLERIKTTALWSYLIPRVQKALTLQWQEKKTAAQIADEIGVTVSTVYHIQTEATKHVLSSVSAQTREEILELLQERRREEQLETNKKISASIRKFDPEAAIVRIRGKHKENILIRYREREFLDFLGISHELFYQFLKIAKEADVVGEPVRNAKHLAFYHRDEIIAVLDHRPKFAEGSEGVESTAKKLREQEKTSDKLTIREAAEKLGISAPVFRRWILEAKVDFLPPTVVETVKRLGSLGARVKLFNAEDLDKEELKDMVLRECEMKGDLTYSKFTRRRNEYTTISDVIKRAGLHIKGAEIPYLVEVLSPEFKIWTFPHGKSTLVKYRVLLKADLERAAEFSRNHLDLQKYKHNIIKQIAGPQIELPTTWHLRIKKDFKSLGNEFRTWGVKIGGKVSVEDLVGEDFPVSVIKHERSNHGRESYQYYYKLDQKPALDAYLQERYG